MEEWRATGLEAFGASAVKSRRPPSFRRYCGSEDVMDAARVGDLADIPPPVNPGKIDASKASTESSAYYNIV
eukprot:5816038-Heterocapsa_arctica.AAC.1